MVEVRLLSVWTWISEMDARRLFADQFSRQTYTLAWPTMSLVVPEPHQQFQVLILGCSFQRILANR